jgi:hypothetical protein
MKNITDTVWDRTSDLPIYSTAPYHCATAVPRLSDTGMKYTDRLISGHSMFPVVFIFHFVSKDIIVSV